MTGKSLLNFINSPEGEKLFVPLYGKDGIEDAQGRYAGLVEGMLKFADKPAQGSGGFSRDTPIRDFPETAGDLRLFTAPGRTELGGNHTDHNQGKVLAASIQLDQAAVAAPRKDGIVVFRSAGYPDVVVDLRERPGFRPFEPVPEEKGTTEALIRGIAAEFVRRGTAVRGFTANAASAVLPGSGLSSSAAVEVLIGKIFDNLYGEGKRSALELAQIGQKAENVFFGKPSGLMDQAACASGGAVAIDFQDLDAPRIVNIAFDPVAAGYALCITDTRGSHADLTDDYAGIPREMKAVAQFFGKTVLRELDWGTVLSRAAEIRNILGDRALLRSRHFFWENQRVDAMLDALERTNSAVDPREKQGALSSFLVLVNESGNSSWELLQNIFAPHKPREQGIALALALTRDFLGKNGACRVHGGGFAGSIQAYIPLQAVSAYRSKMEAVFGPGVVTELRIRSAGAAELYL
ncbi:MAG: galactokinase [Treponema sp.]|jgi:galactokinase|nr:galactokinase [Treponema sp.]